MNSSSNKLSASFPNIVLFYQSINNDAIPYHHSMTMNILNNGFFLNLINKKEKNFSSEEFESYHDHCFETPLLAICHIAGQHQMKITDDELLEVIKTLVALGANIHAQDEDGNTPILLLASSYHAEERPLLLKSLSYLLSLGADINIQNEEGKTVLHCAYEIGNFELASFFSSRNAQVLLDDEGNSFINELESLDEKLFKRHINDFINHLKSIGVLTDIANKAEDLLYQRLTTEQDEEVQFLNNEDSEWSDLPVTLRALQIALDEDFVESLAFVCLSHQIAKIERSPSKSLSLSDKPVIEYNSPSSSPSSFLYSSSTRHVSKKPRYLSPPRLMRQDEKRDALPEHGSLLSQENEKVTTNSSLSRVLNDSSDTENLGLEQTWVFFKGPTKTSFANPVPSSEKEKMNEKGPKKRLGSVLSEKK